MKPSSVLAFVAAGSVCLGAFACGGSSPRTRAAPGGSNDPSKWPADDQSMCERFVHWRNSPVLEASETAGPSSIRPNIRRIFKTVGDRDSRHSVLLCREIDTNLDGIKDVVRTFNEKGEPLHEEADRNFDGRVDVWLNFSDGRIEEEDIDTTFSAGRPNVWKFYVDGQISRIRRNTHCPSGAADTWEIYYKDRLERVGSDATCDGHVDRWDRDAQLLAAEEAAQEKAQADAGAGGTSASGTSASSAGASIELADAGPQKAAKKRR
jgi:hypothetical protein